MKTIRVIHIPFTKRNPYQKLLCSELESLDCSIKKVKTRKLYFLNITILYTLLVHWKPDIVHLHWHHSSLIEISKLKSIIKSIFFLFQIRPPGHGPFLRIVEGRMVYFADGLES